MKIRAGFIANSSSSSFICGKEITYEVAKELMDKYVKINKKENFWPGFNEHSFYINTIKKNHYDEYYVEHFLGRVIIFEDEQGSIPRGICYNIEKKLNAIEDRG